MYYHFEVVLLLFMFIGSNFFFFRKARSKKYTVNERLFIGWYIIPLVVNLAGMFALGKTMSIISFNESKDI